MIRIESKDEIAIPTTIVIVVELDSGGSVIIWMGVSALDDSELFS